MTPDDAARPVRLGAVQRHDVTRDVPRATLGGMDNLDTNPGVARGLKILIAVVYVAALIVATLVVAVAVVANSV